MDLGAFLKPGVTCSIKVSGAYQAQESSEARGYLIERRGHPLWALDSPQPVGRELTITLRLPGYNLAEDGSLKETDMDGSAPVVLLGLVTGCRFFNLKRVYLIRLKLLGRVFE